jgi:hypothetical protein
MALATHPQIAGAATSTRKKRIADDVCRVPCQPEIYVTSPNCKSNVEVKNIIRL